MKNNDLAAPPKMDFPFASIIVPVFNGEKSISKCIESLLSQDYPTDRYEIIVVDNDSNDRTGKIIQEHPVRYVLENRSQSSYSSRNAGVGWSKGDALVFFDADQVADKNLLKELLKFWKHSEYGAFGGREINVVPNSPIIEQSFHVPMETPMKRGFVVLGAGCAAYRKTVFEALGGFDETFASQGDLDLAVLLQKRLGLSIKYNFDAVFFHMQPRATLLALWKRESRLGFGFCRVGAKHPELKKVLPLWILKVIKRTVLGSMSFVYGIVKPLHELSRKQHLQKIMLDTFLRWAYLSGMIYYHLGARRCGDLPLGTDSGKRKKGER
jgi:glycosyltransferase AglI